MRALVDTALLVPVVKVVFEGSVYVESESEPLEGEYIRVGALRPPSFQEEIQEVFEEIGGVRLVDAWLVLPA